MKEYKIIFQNSLTFNYCNFELRFLIFIKLDLLKRCTAALKLVVIFTLGILLYSCANIVPPSGGDIDKTPPKLVAMTPSDSLLNTKVKKIVLRFDKFVEVRDLQKNMVLAPLLEVAPTVMANKKTVEIKIVDSLLKENTTYKISLGKAITDNREKTPYEGFSYTFSTGAYFDSLMIKGSVVDVLTGNPDTGIAVHLYPEPFNDSSLFVKKPMYVTITDANGNFEFSGLPNLSFKLFAIADVDGNRMFDRTTEKIGFLDSSVRSAVNDSNVISYHQLRTSLMTPVAKIDTTKKDEKPLAQYVGRLTNKAKNAKAYSVAVDTAIKDKGTFDLTSRLEIKLNTVIGKLDSAKIFLSYLNPGGIESQANTTIESDSLSLYLKTNWIPESQYTLRLVKGWAVDTSGAEILPGKYEFRTKALDDYAKLSVKIPDTFMDAKNVLIILQEKDTIYNKALSDSIIPLQMLKPGTVQILLLKDANGNGKWDPGDVFAKLQPEQIFHHESPVLLKAGWEHEEHFKFRKPGTPVESKSMRMRGGASPKGEKFEEKE